MMDGFLGAGGSDANLLSDVNLLLYLLLIMPAMIVGFVFARRKMFRPYHKMTMTAITIVNWVIIVALMAGRYAQWVAPYLQFGVAEPVRLIPSIHLITGGLAQLLGTYLVVLMWTEKTRFAGILPAAVRIRNIKPFMRLTLALWLVTALLGITTYLSWYPPAGAASDVAAPVATEEVAPEATPELTPEVEVAATEEA